MVPIADLVLNILKDVVGDLVLGYSNEIIFALVVASLADPYRIALLAGHIRYVLEVFQPHFLVWTFFEAGLIGVDEGFCQVRTMISKDTLFLVRVFEVVAEGIDHPAAETVHHWQAFSQEEEDH